MSRIGWVAALCLLCVHGVAQAQSRAGPEPAPIEAYGRLPAFERAQLSGSGDRLAVVKTEGDERFVLIQSLPDAGLLGGARIGDVKVRDLVWVDDEHVLIVTSSTQRWPSGVDIEAVSGQIYALQTGRLRSIFDRVPNAFEASFSIEVVQMDGKPTVVFEAINDVSYEPDLLALDPTTMAVRRLEGGSRETTGYVLDRDGQRLARVTYNERDGAWALQTRPGPGSWRSIWSITALIDTPTVDGIGPDGDSLTVLAPSEDGSDPAWKLIGLNGNWRPMPFDGNPDELIYHPQTGRLIGARFDDADGERYAFIDPAAGRAWRSILAAFEGYRPRLRSWSHDMRQAVVFTSGSQDSGRYFFVDLDRATGSLLGEAYPLVTNDRVGEIRAITYSAADGLEIPGYLSLPPGVTEPENLPLIVLPHGGPAARDYLEFDWWAQALASRGYAVLQANFRGSSELGQAHLEAGFGEWGRKMQTDLSDGVRWLADQGMIDPSRVCIVGASYGGYAALAGATLDVGVYRCAVSVAGVSDLRDMLRWTADRNGSRNNGTNRYWNRFMGTERSTDASLDALSPARLADRVEIPILLIHGRDDTVVPFSQTSTMASALRRAGKAFDLVELPGEDHWLSGEETRSQMLTQTVAFLQRYNPPD
ncbi:S9 family peptidase [Brevundimonas sp. AJA228-03]|uniref:alpha/beta hydrolase family protein n=1 Tax=Brevundimonas sp. AJA228-03 TaxID=2752515 RepID=UPI001AE02128|nr:S9 family peptidase [Brevundimonas sp. AJA228-03]QTN20262.1 S9 family peptidase [Brevundimonas sp. AJA228-03]